MNTNELINKFADTCLNITTAAFDGTVEGKDYTETVQQTEDILISVLSDIAGTRVPVKRVTLNLRKENECCLTIKHPEFTDSDDRTELADMYVFVTDAVIELSDKNGAKNFFALFYSRARKEVVFKIRSADGKEDFLNIGSMTCSEFPIDKFIELAKDCTPISIQGNALDKDGISSFLDEKAK